MRSITKTNKERYKQPPLYLEFVHFIRNKRSVCGPFAFIEIVQGNIITDKNDGKAPLGHVINGLWYTHHDHSTWTDMRIMTTKPS